MKDSLKIAPETKQPGHRRVYAGLRAQISSGEMGIGQQLPSTRALAIAWDTNPFTIHTALTALAREGWVRRRGGSGTFVSDPQARFHCAGLYLPAAIAAQPDRQFLRYLQMSIVRHLEKAGKAAEIFLDPRPPAKQGTPPRPLAEALRQDRIQCVIAPELNAWNARFMTRLTVPFSTSSDIDDPRRAIYDSGTFFRRAVQQLKVKGCRTVGLLTSVAQKQEDIATRVYFTAFHEAVAAAGLRTHRTWISDSHESAPDMEALGYHEFRRIWKLKSHPEGIIVFPDQVARGVILGVMEAGKESVAREIQFVLHRNAHQPMLCPMRVIWATTDEEVMARSLIAMVEKQFRREPLEPTRIPLIFTESDGI